MDPSELHAFPLVFFWRRCSSTVYIVTRGAVGTVCQLLCGLSLSQKICCAVADIYLSPIGFAVLFGLVYSV